MTFRLYLFVMSIASATAWIAWIVVLNAVDPLKTGLLGFMLFYTTLFIALSATFSILGAGLRAWKYPGVLATRHTTRALRQGILFSLLILSTLFLSAGSLLRWWSLLLFILIATFIEVIFLTLRSSR